MIAPKLEINSNPDILLGGDSGSYGNGSTTFQPTLTNTNSISNSPFGNVKIYDLDEEIKPIPKNNVTTGATVGQNPFLTQNTGATTTGATTTGVKTGATTGVKTGATINEDTLPATIKKSKYLLYVGGALLVGFIIYKLVKK